MASKLHIGFFSKRKNGGEEGGLDILHIPTAPMKDWISRDQYQFVINIFSYTKI